MPDSLTPTHDRGSLVHVIETLLDKGLVINADIVVSVGGVELLGIKIRAAIASFKTAAEYGLEFPGGTDPTSPGWRAALHIESCPGCGKRSEARVLLEDSCPWCGWKSAQAQRISPAKPAALRPARRRKSRRLVNPGA